jgi:hypothetical protein
MNKLQNRNSVKNMIDSIIKILVRSQFLMTSRNHACKKAVKIVQSYEKLAEDLDHMRGTHRVVVPSILGVDEDMRNWSFYMILEHNSIVNRTITAIVKQLVRGETQHGAATINPKTDVMPSISADEKQLQIFQRSVNKHLQVIRELGTLRGSKTAPHPIFGAFDAHKWNCMLPFHLQLHYKQAALVVRMAQKDR